jgi:hypothetical protein
MAVPDSPGALHAGEEQERAGAHTTSRRDGPLQGTTPTAMRGAMRRYCICAMRGGAQGLVGIWWVL